MFVQLSTLYTAHLTINQAEFVSLEIQKGYGNYFVKVTEGDDYHPKVIDTERIYSIKELESTNLPIVCRTDSIEANALRKNNFSEVNAYWGGESRFWRKNVEILATL
jgi:hypothetical protein